MRPKSTSDSKCDSLCNGLLPTTFLSISIGGDAARPSFQVGWLKLMPAARFNVSVEFQTRQQGAVLTLVLPTHTDPSLRESASCTP
jgi:hypothetical protein